MKAELLIRAISHAQCLDNLTYTGKKDKKITARGKETYSQREKLDISTIQGALGMCRLPPLISNLLYAKYQGIQARDLESQINQLILVEWNGPPLNTEKAARLVIQEFIHHHRCISCRGSKRSMVLEGSNKGKVVPCSLCRGTGKRRPTGGARAEYFGVHRQLWKRKYSIPFAYIQSEIDKLLNRGEAGFIRKMV